MIFRDLTLELRNLICKTLKINEELRWNAFCDYKCIDEGKSTVDFQSLHSGCEDYLSKFRKYVESHKDYKNEIADNSYLDQETAEIQKMSSDAVDALKKKIEMKEFNSEKINIQVMIEDLNLITGCWLENIC